MSAATEQLEVLDPSDLREVVGSVPKMTAADVPAVYDTAAEAALEWGATSSVSRGRILLRAAELIRERHAEIARVLTREMGKTLAEAGGEVGKTADFFEYFGGIGRGDAGALLAHERADVTAYTLHEPLGVVLAITPWNDPLLTPARKTAPALIAGNTVILKPASYTPLVAFELQRCLLDAGLPPGVFEVLTGTGRSIGESLIDHPALAAVSFTGSNEVGTTLRTALAERAIPLLAELGGKNASVVLAGAALDRAVTTIVAAGFAQAGQRCTATSRVIVERTVRDEVVEGLCAAAESFKLGPGIAADTTMGPLVSGEQRDTVLGFVERARSAGATLVTGGERLTDAGRQHGCYVTPAVMTDVSTDMEIWTDEVFGPVITVVVADDPSSALDLLNDSPYGLAAALYSNDHAAIQRFIREAHVGQVAVNLPTSGWDVQMPFGGQKASGSGHKEQGLEGLEFYRQTKTVAIAS
jgi:acyl-CoA reductase-like NAD-dependent aldehyde dehydrogenase